MEARSDSQATGRGEEDVRALSARLVNAIYRLVKACQIHAENNQAVAQVVDFVVETIDAFNKKANVTAAAILFTNNAVFVNRKMLRASRETYQLALELGQILEPCGVTEVTLHQEVTPAEVAEFGRAVADFVRESKKSARLTEGGWEGIKLRKVQGLTFSENLTPPVKAARTYAAALMIVRGFYADLKKGNYELKQGIKRVAQKLVSQTETGSRLLLSIAAAPPADADRAGVALSTAIVALAMATQVTEDRTLLSALASAALLYDAGRPRLVGYDKAGEGRAQRVLNAEEEELVPVSSVVALTALGKFHPPSVTRAVLVHEALALRDEARLYGGKRQASILSRILATARSFVEMRVGSGTSPGVALDDALQVLESQARDNTERALVKLLLGALGVFPAGTMVELSTGEMAVVLTTPALPVDFARPPVRIMYDASAQLLETPIDVDLSKAPSPGEPQRYIKRPIDTTDQQMKQMRAYVVQLAAKRARRNSIDQMRAIMARGEQPPPSSRTPASFESDISSHPSGPSSDRSHPSAHSAPMRAPSSDPRGRARPPTRQWDGRAEIGGGAAEERPRGERAGAGIAVPSGTGPVVPAPTTRALKWGEYEKELAEAASKPPAINDTDAILAAYLSEEQGRAASPPTQRPSSSGDQPISAQGDGQSGEARSFGLRWNDRASAQGAEGSSSGFGGPGRSTGGGFGSQSRGITGSPGSNPRSAVERSSAGFGSANRGITGDRISSGFGSAGRGVTGGAGLRLGREPDSSQSAGGYPPTPHPAGARGASSSGGIRWGGKSERATPPPSSPRAADEDSFSFEERPFDVARAGTQPGAAKPVPQPLRGSLGRQSSSSMPVVTAPHDDGPEIDVSPLKPVRVPVPAAPKPAPAAAPPAPKPIEPPASEVGVSSKRTKTSAVNWGAPRRDGKK